MRMMLGHGSRLALVGIALGIAGALVVSRLMPGAVRSGARGADGLHRPINHGIAGRGGRVVLSGAESDQN
jgi:hypothetical protein